MNAVEMIQLYGNLFYVSLAIAVIALSSVVLCIYGIRCINDVLAIDVEDVVYERLENLRSPKTRHKLVLSSEGGIKGVSDELGLPAKELQRMVGFNAFALPKNGGVSLQKMAESIAE